MLELVGIDGLFCRGLHLVGVCAKIVVVGWCSVERRSLGFSLHREHFVDLKHFLRLV